VKKTLVVVGLLALVSVGALVIAGEVPADKAEIKFDTKMGTVTFPHKVHSGLEGVSCTSCHHTLKEGATPQACSSCHDPKMEKDGAPKLKDAVHNNCYGCHQEKADAGMKSGPLKKDCKACHVKG
jgi:predicted CXXCH cytochrome family protein